MTKAIRLHTGLNLDAAKTCTDSVLAGTIVIVDVATPSDAQVLAETLVALGANAVVTE